MENNFYVGVVYHGKRVFRSEYCEKLVLYSDDNINFLDLLGGIYYTTDMNNKDYVDEETIISTDISLYRDDYIYLLSKYKENALSRKKEI